MLALLNTEATRDVANSDNQVKIHDLGSGIEDHAIVLRSL